MGLHGMEIMPGSFGANEQMWQDTTYQELERDDGKGHPKAPGYGGQPIHPTPSLCSLSSVVPAHSFGLRVGLS